MNERGQRPPMSGAAKQDCYATGFRASPEELRRALRKVLVEVERSTREKADPAARLDVHG